MFGFPANRKKLLANKSLLGQWGEKRCEKFLKAKGLNLLTRNFLCKTGEIDLVMVNDNGAIVFVEVKTRADESYTDVENAITPDKKKKLFRASRYFLATHDIQNRAYRFDVVSIVLGQKGPIQIRHYENAFIR